MKWTGAPQPFRKRIDPVMGWVSSTPFSAIAKHQVRLHVVC
jgi:hypothetical protein